MPPFVARQPVVVNDGLIVCISKMRTFDNVLLVKEGDGASATLEGSGARAGHRLQELIWRELSVRWLLTLRGPEIFKLLSGDLGDGRSSQEMGVAKLKKKMPCPN